MQGADQRRQQIIQLLQRESILSNQQLSELLHTTPATIRRDLDLLENSGVLVRTWGKATLLEQNEKAPPISARTEVSSDEKKIIAKYASSLIGEGDSIILDSGTTILALAEELCGFGNLSVVTNSIPVAYTLLNSNVSVQFSGGFFEKEHMSLVGPESEKFFESISVSKVFLGATCLRLPQGFATYSPFQCGVKRRMIKAAEKVYVLMDSSKVNAHGINTFADFKDIDFLITTKQIEPLMETQLIESGIQIIYTEKF